MLKGWPVSLQDGSWDLEWATQQAFSAFAHLHTLSLGVSGSTDALLALLAAQRKRARQLEQSGPEQEQAQTFAGGLLFPRQCNVSDCVVGGLEIDAFAHAQHCGSRVFAGVPACKSDWCDDDGGGHGLECMLSTWLSSAGC